MSTYVGRSSLRAQKRVSCIKNVKICVFCIANQPSPTCLVLWSTCQRITGTGRVWTRWSVRVCALHLLPNRFLFDSSHASLRAGWDSDRCPCGGTVSLCSCGQTDIFALWGDVTGCWGLSLCSRMVLSGGGVVAVENGLSFEGPLDFPAEYSTARVDLTGHLTISTVQSNTTNLHFS